MSDIKSEHKAPGENSVVRLVVMESGTRHVYYKDKLIGSIGDDDSLVVTLEGLVDEAWERACERAKENLMKELSKPEVLNQFRIAGFVETLKLIGVQPKKKPWWKPGLINQKVIYQWITQLLMDPTTKVRPSDDPNFYSCELDLYQFAENKQPIRFWRLTNVFPKMTMQTDDAGNHFTKFVCIVGEGMDSLPYPQSAMMGLENELGL